MARMGASRRGVRDGRNERHRTRHLDLHTIRSKTSMCKIFIWPIVYYNWIMGMFSARSSTVTDRPRRRAVRRRAVDCAPIVSRALVVHRPCPAPRVTCPRSSSSSSVTAVPVRRDFPRLSRRRLSRTSRLGCPDRPASAPRAGATHGGATRSAARMMTDAIVSRRSRVRTHVCREDDVCEASLDWGV